MRANLSFRTALKAAPAVLAATMGLSAVPDAARASTISSSSGLTITGDPGTTITYLAQSAGGYFNATVSSSNDAGVMFYGAPGFFTLSSSDMWNGFGPSGGGVYSQEFGGEGNFTLDDAFGNFVAGAEVGSGAIYAVPGASSAIIQLDVYSVVQTPSGPQTGPVVGYLVLSGTTSSPVSVVTTNPTCLQVPGPCVQPYFNTFTLDWTATYQATPYVPTSKTSAIPEPSTWAMMLLGFAGLGFARWRVSRGSAA